MHRYLLVAKLALMGHAPFGDALRNVKRRLLGYKPNPGNIRDTVADLDEMQQQLLLHGRSFEGARVLEIGSGWFPTVPLALSLRGAREVILADHVKHLDDVSFAAACQHLASRYPSFETLAGRTRFEEFPFRYAVPFLPSGMPDCSIDVVISRAVLEHIDEPVLEQIHRQLLPKLARGGALVHCIDHSDHLAHHDKSISMLNFLSWPDWKHRLVNRLTCEGENRLRHSDYARLFERCGYRVLAEQRTVHPPSLAALAKLRLAPRFQGYAAEDLATLRSIFVLEPAAG